MTEEVSITFYNIDKCGYYKHGNQTAEFGGSVGAILNQLTNWVDGLELRSTFTYEPNDQHLKTYCYNIKQKQNRFLLATWNEVPNSDGLVPGVKGSAHVGSASVEHAEFHSSDAIPGYPAYFYFIPSKNIFATITIGNQLNGQQNLVRFITGFLERHGDHAVRLIKDDDKTIYIAYRETPTSKARRLKPYFRTSLRRNPGKIDEILSRRTEIRKLVSHSTLTHSSSNNVALYQKLLAVVGLIEVSDKRLTSIDFGYEMDFMPSEGELKTIISDWESRLHTAWEDVGFKLKGEQSPFWLSKSMARTKHSFEIERDDDEMIVVTKLLDSLLDHEASILEETEL